MASISDYILGSGKGAKLDIGALKKLSLEEFREIHLNEMRNYVKNHSKNPRCLYCEKEILSPEDLRRYFGCSLDSECFIEIFSKERKSMRKGKRYILEYFDLVARL